VSTNECLTKELIGLAHVGALEIGFHFVIMHELQLRITFEIRTSYHSFDNADLLRDSVLKKFLCHN
jgi:hypothetical protein